VDAALPHTVLVLRHGDRSHDVLDPSLTEVGAAQAASLAATLANSGIDCIFSSPFLRALQTATPIALALGLPIRVDRGTLAPPGPEASAWAGSQHAPPAHAGSSLCAQACARCWPTTGCTSRTRCPFCTTTWTEHACPASPASRS
jgi:hypothetical protein